MLLGRKLSKTHFRLTGLICFRLLAFATVIIFLRTTLFFSVMFCSISYCHYQKNKCEHAALVTKRKKDFSYKI